MVSDEKPGVNRTEDLVCMKIHLFPAVFMILRLWFLTDYDVSGRGLLRVHPPWNLWRFFRMQT